MKRIVLSTFLALWALSVSSQVRAIEPYCNLNDITTWDYFKTNDLSQYRILFDEKKTCIKGVKLFNGAETKSITLYFKKPMTKEALHYLKDRKKSIFCDRKLLHRKIKYLTFEEK